MADFNDIFMKCEKICEKDLKETGVSIEQAGNDLINVIFTALNEPEIDVRCFRFTNKTEYRYSISDSDKVYGEHLRCSSIIRKSMKKFNMKKYSYDSFKIIGASYYDTDFEIHFNELQIIKIATDTRNEKINVTIIKMDQDQ